MFSKRWVMASALAMSFTTSCDRAPRPPQPIEFVEYGQPTERLHSRQIEKDLARWNGLTATVEGVVEATNPSDHFPALLSGVTHVFIVVSKRRL